MRERLYDSPFRQVCFDGDGEPRPLWRMLGYCSDGADGLPCGVTLRGMLGNGSAQSFLRGVVRGIPGVGSSCGDVLWLPFVLLAGEMVLLGGDFQAGGVVPLAELLAVIGRYTGCVGDSLDGVSHAGDYYNAGYNACGWGYSSPFLRQYGRGGLFGALTRFDLAFLVGVCWKGLAAVRGNAVFGDRFGVKVYEDGFRVDVVKQDLREGVGAVPRCVVESAARLDESGLFRFGGRFDPLREVSRLEFAGFIFNLACAAADGKILY